ncbi:MAG: ATP-grasp domain-containing protein, partial [Chromatiales bacterium]
MQQATILSTTSQETEFVPGKAITLKNHDFLNGCNPYYSSSVVRQSIEFGDLSYASTVLAGKNFSKYFLSRFLGIKSFLPRNGLNQKFITSLDSPQGADFPTTFLEAILAVEAATAFARHELVAVRYAGIKTFENHHDLVWASQTPRLSKEITEVALLGLLELLPLEYQPDTEQDKTDFATSLDALLNKARRSRMAASTAVVKLAASTRGFPCELMGQQHLVVGHGAKQKHLYASMTSTTPITAQKICSDKRQTNRRLKQLRLPVPMHSRVGTVEAATKAAENLGLPVIVKPVKGKKGLHVSDKISSLDEVASAFDVAHFSGSDVLVEQYVNGEDYRLLVIDGKFHSAVLRKPPKIVGDGKSTVSQLVEQMNQDPYRDSFRGFPVIIDSEINTRLAEAGLSLEDVPEQGQEIVLRLRANVSTGGIPTDATDLVHPEVRAMAERAAKAVDLTVAGIDYLTTDIERSPEESKGVIIEINARPGLDIHVWPYAGISRDAGGSLLEHLFPSGDRGRVTVVASAGDQGTGTPARIVEALLRKTGKRSALTLRSEAYADGRKTRLSKKQQEKAPLVMLQDPEVDSLVTTVSLRQTAKRGMLLEHCDVAMIMDRAKPGAVKAFLVGLDVIIKATTRCIVVGSGNLVALKRIESVNNGAKLIVVNANRNDPSLQTHLDAGRIGVTAMWQDGQQNIAILSADKIIGSFSLEALADKNTDKP